MRKDWYIHSSDRYITPLAAIHDQTFFLNFSDYGMDKFFKDNEELHESPATPFMVMSGSHSFIPCFNPSGFANGYNTSSSFKTTLT